MIIDAHVHLPEQNEQRSFEQSKMLLLADMHQAGIDHAILIPDNISPSSIGDLPTCLELVKDTPQLSLMGTIDIQTQGDEWLAYLEDLIVQRRIVAVKIFPGHDPIYPTDPRLALVYAMCQLYHIPMVIHTGCNPDHPEVAQYNDPIFIVEVARQYPVLKIVIAHYFFPEVDYCYEITRPYPNIYFDTSGLADAEVIAATGAERIRSVLLKTLRDNPKSIVFGTDYAMCTFEQHLELIDNLPLDDDLRQAILWHNTVELFNLILT
jgi:hypothetical protein